MWDTFSEISNLETSIDLSKMLNLGIGYRNITEQLAQPTGQLDLSYKVNRYNKTRRGPLQCSGQWSGFNT